MRPEDNQSNTLNPNKGFSGTNKQYSQNQGNRGKQLNPNQANTLIVLVKSSVVVEKQNPLDRCNDLQLSFKSEYLDKGFLKKIGATLLDKTVVEERELKAPHDNELREPIENYFFIEYSIPITGGVDGARNRISKDFKDELYWVYESFFWLNDTPITNMDHYTLSLDY